MRSEIKDRDLIELFFLLGVCVSEREDRFETDEKKTYKPVSICSSSQLTVGSGRVSPTVNTSTPRLYRTALNQDHRSYQHQWQLSVRCVTSAESLSLVKPSRAASTSVIRVSSRSFADQCLAFNIGEHLYRIQTLFVHPMPDSILLTQLQHDGRPK